jgi:hypothetical protein
LVNEPLISNGLVLVISLLDYIISMLMLCTHTIALFL